MIHLADFCIIFIVHTEMGQVVTLFI